ncbi:unnamed protein product [Mycena citricolor]|uniref:Uncharacterized protein n=1 Tax=Mycena citricolor TaxID=2018698 RepID=A0AAD2Q7D5_9AGAR|nr:unnamed protein product [Mycena citricolor]
MDVSTVKPARPRPGGGGLYGCMHMSGVFGWRSDELSNRSHSAEPEFARSVTQMCLLAQELDWRTNEEFEYWEGETLHRSHSADTEMAPRGCGMGLLAQDLEC